jgi:hypothetical protein
MTASTEILQQKIESTVEQLVREHLAAMEAAASAAVREGMRRATRAPSTRPDRGGGSRRRAGSHRRTPEELAGLEEQLYAAICAHPGETMSVIAPSAGSSPRELARPATRLREASQIRSVGRRQGTRYFPVGA